MKTCCLKIVPGVRRAAGMTILLTGVLLLLGGVSSAQQESLLIGYVNMKEIREGFREYQTKLSEIQVLKTEEQELLDGMAADFDESVRLFESKVKAGGLTGEQEAKERDALRRKYEILTQHKMEKDQELFVKSRDKLKPLITRIRDAIRDVAVSNSYHLVFYSSDLAYSDPRLDLTGSVTEALNSQGG